jgi:hypothetical protein
MNELAKEHLRAKMSALSLPTHVLQTWTIEQVADLMADFISPKMETTSSQFDKLLELKWRAGQNSADFAAHWHKKYLRQACALRPQITGEASLREQVDASVAMPLWSIQSHESIQSHYHCSALIRAPQPVRAGILWPNDTPDNDPTS